MTFGTVLRDLPFAYPADAQRWMHTASVETLFGQPQSQCQFMRDDPKGYMQAAY
jgi:hypothetical protein